MAWTSRELWQNALRGDVEITVQHIEHMVAAKRDEDLHLDWKGGSIVTERNREAVEKGVAGFANGEGGVLVLGVRGGDVQDDSWTLDYCPAKVGKLPLKEWVERQLERLMTTLRPQPRVLVIGEEDKRIALIAVQRTDQLTAVVVKNKGLVHYLRFYGSTHEVPPYLLADLMLGRRRQPQLAFENVKAVITPNRRDPFKPVSVQVTFDLRNIGLVWAQQPALGVAHLWESSAPLPNPVAPHVNVGSDLEPLRVKYSESGNRTDLAPYQTRSAVRFAGATKSNARYSPRWHGVHWRMEWLAAAHISCINGTPVWYQVRVVYNEHYEVLEASAELADGLPLIDIRYLREDYREFDEWVPA